MKKLLITAFFLLLATFYIPKFEVQAETLETYYTQFIVNNTYTDERILQKATISVYTMNGTKLFEEPTDDSGVLNKRSNGDIVELPAGTYVAKLESYNFESVEQVFTVEEGYIFRQDIQLYLTPQKEELSIKQAPNLYTQNGILSIFNEKNHLIREMTYNSHSDNKLQLPTGNYNFVYEGDGYYRYEKPLVINQNQETSIDIYPTPIEEKIEWEFRIPYYKAKDIKNVKIEIFDENEELFRTYKEEYENVEMTLPPGTYTAKVTFGGNTEVPTYEQSLVVNKGSSNSTYARFIYVEFPEMPDEYPFQKEPSLTIIAKSYFENISVNATILNEAGEKVAAFNNDSITKDILEPGHYTATIHKEGYYTENIHFDINSQNESLTIMLNLQAKDENITIDIKNLYNKTQILATSDVQLTNTATDEVLYGVVNNKEQFVFNKVPLGNYQLTIETPGYRKVEEQVTILKGEDKWMPIRLLEDHEYYHRYDERQADTKVTTDHTFKITFNSDVNVHSVTNDSVYVMDANGKKVERLEFSYDKANKQLSVINPSKYVENRKYYLYVTSDVKSATNTFLQQPVQFSFITEAA